MKPVTTVGTRCNHVVTEPAVAYDNARFCMQCGSVLVRGDDL